MNVLSHTSPICSRSFACNSKKNKPPEKKPSSCSHDHHDHNHKSKEPTSSCSHSVTDSGSTLIQKRIEKLLHGKDVFPHTDQGHALLKELFNKIKHTTKVYEELSTIVNEVKDYDSRELLNYNKPRTVEQDLFLHYFAKIKQTEETASSATKMLLSGAVGVAAGVGSMLAYMKFKPSPPIELVLPEEDDDDEETRKGLPRMLSPQNASV